MNKKSQDEITRPLDEIVIFQNYLNILEPFKRNPEICNQQFFDFTIEFCENNNLYDLFVECKLNPVAFYAFAKYKVRGWPLSKLEKAIEIVNSR